MFHRPDILREPNVEAIARWVYHLAYFLLDDRRDSLSAFYQAVARLSVTALTQKKRQAKRPKTEVHKKLSLTRRQLLQYLLYVCSEPYERMQEQEHRAGRCTLSQEDMIARYVKHLVQLYLEHNSFYAAVGHSCVLFDLGTSQAEWLYEILVQGSPAHLNTKGDYSVRDAKREIRQRLAGRFGEFVSTQEGPRKEQRFVTMPDAGAHFRFVKWCLHRLQPVPSDDGRAGHWHLPAAFDPMAYGLAELEHDEANGNPRAEQAAELRRMHVVVHPCCWARLLRASGHAYNRRRLLLPGFNLARDGNSDNMPPSDRHPPELTSDELDGLFRVLEKEARRRSALFSSDLTVAVDGIICCRWSLDATDRLKVVVGADARVLSVSDRDQEGEVLLALHLLQFGGAGGQVAEPFGVTVESGREFTFTVARRSGGPGDLDGFEVLIHFRETKPHKAALSYLARRYKGFVGATPLHLIPPVGLKVFALTCAAVLVALVGGWWLTRAPRSQRPSETAERHTPPPEPQAVEPLRAIPEDSGRADPATPREGVVRAPSAPPAPSPTAASGVRTPRATPEPRGQSVKVIGRSPRGNESARPGSRDEARRPPPGEEERNTRGARGGSAGSIGLVDVRQVYVDPLSGSPFGAVLQRHLAAAVGASGRLRLASERLSADAVLVGEIAEAAERLRIDVRLVNIQGRVLWRKRMSVEKDERGETHPGTAVKLIGALLRRIRAESRRG